MASFILNAFLQSDPKWTKTELFNYQVHKNPCQIKSIIQSKQQRVQFPDCFLFWRFWEIMWENRESPLRFSFFLYKKARTARWNSFRGLAIQGRFIYKRLRNNHPLKGQFMIKVEPSSDCFTLFFRNRPILKVSTHQPFIEMGAQASSKPQSTQEKDPSDENSARSNSHSFQLIE